MLPFHLQVPDLQMSCSDLIRMRGYQDKVPEANDIKINAVRPHDAIWRRQSWLTLIRALICRIFCVEPSIEPVVTYFQLDPWEQKYIQFLSRKCFENVECKMSASLFMSQFVKCMSNSVDLLLSESHSVYKM